MIVGSCRLKGKNLKENFVVEPSGANTAGTAEADGGPWLGPARLSRSPGFRTEHQHLSSRTAFDALREERGIRGLRTPCS